MEEQKLIQMIRFDHDLVVFIEGSDDQQRQVNIYGYAMHQAVNVWDYILTHRGLLLPWNAVDGGTVWKPRY